MVIAAKSLTNTTRIAGIDAVRYLSFIFIVILHCLPDARVVNEAGVFISYLTRFAVPFFFITSGYFLGRSDPDPIPGLIKLLKRLLPIFGFWVLVYLAAWGKLSDLTHVRSVLRILLSGGAAYHLWFLPALGVSSALLLVLKRYGWNLLISLAFILYILGLAFGPYVEWIGLPVTEFNTRNGPFFGFAFVLSGYYLSKENCNAKFSTGLILAILGMGLQLFEVWLIPENTIRPKIGYDCLVGTFFFGLGVFIMALNSGDHIKGPFVKLGSLTLGMYCIHVLFLVFLRKYLDFNILSDDIIIITATVMLSTFATLLFARIPYLNKVFR